MSFEHSVRVLVNYIRRQERQWGHVNTPWGTLLILPEANLNPILREVERWLEIESEGRAERVNVFAPLSPTMQAEREARVPEHQQAVNPDPPVQQHTAEPTFVSASTSLGGKAEINPGT